MAGAVLIAKNYGLCVMLYLYDWHFNFDRSFSNQEGKNIKFDHKCVNEPLMINKILVVFFVWLAPMCSENQITAIKTLCF